MSYNDSVLARRLAGRLKRVLILDNIQSSAGLLSELLRDIGVQRVSIQPNNLAATASLGRFDPQLIFTELSGHGLDGLAFTRALRRGDAACRQAPVIIFTAAATAAAILAARQAGAHEFLRKPYSINDVMRRLDAAILRPRAWVEAINYVGPDRRRFNSGDYAGARKRRCDEDRASDVERIAQALKILRSAIGALERDPVQALRAMRAQAAELQQIAVTSADLKLMEAASGLHRCLIAAISSGQIERDAVEAAANGLWAFTPAGAPW